MGFRTGSYASVWKVESKSDKCTTARISISRKDRNGEGYYTEFSGFVDFLGTAVAKKALGLKEGDRIKLGDVDVTNTYNKDTKREFTSYKVFSFDIESGSGNQSGGGQSGRTQSRATDAGFDDSSDLPF